MKSMLIKIWSWIRRYQILIIGIVIFTIWISAPWWVSFFPGIGSVERKGQFGDSFGGLNALFSGFAFLGVIYAILLQREQIQLQSKELKAQRKELKLQREELGLQREVMQKDTFERTFFRLLEMLDVERARTDEGGTFSALTIRDGKISRNYSTQQLKAYFLSLFKILQFVSDANLGIEDDEEDHKIKKFYTDILRDDISFKLERGQEVRSLFVLLMDVEECIETFPHIDQAAFIGFAEKYALLSHIDINYLNGIWNKGFDFCLRFRKEVFADNFSSTSSPVRNVDWFYEESAKNDHQGPWAHNE